MSQFFSRIVGNIRTSFQHVHAIGFVVYASDFSQFCNGFLIFFRGGWGTEKNGVGNDSGKHHTSNSLGWLDACGFVETPNDGVHAAYRTNQDENRIGGFKITDAVMVDQFQYIGFFDAIDTLFGFIVVHQNQLGAWFYRSQVFRFCYFEIVQCILGFFVQFACSSGYSVNALLLFQIGIRNSCCNAVCIWGFMSDNKNFAHKKRSFTFSLLHSN